ncbi:GTPase domain-containing protein [Janibacter hoylei]|uniref:GTPase domain-containing protein n=1 Tax=Janibacter hoylei TaxID=364298 RepID=UPI002490CF7B|nr:GTPase domain-containing protein [Janibacter hoylei]
MLRADSDVTAIRAELEKARDELRGASELSSDDRVRGPASRAVELLENSLASSQGDQAATNRLTVALLGRTKAGKSQLVAALTGDAEGSGVGVGRHRTTTEERVVHLPEFDLVDLPGVSALDGEEDTELALTLAERADAVLWIYAESLQDAEAFELEDLMRKGKPVVVAFNVKQSIANEGLRRVFTKYPDRTFRDLESHRVRVAQIADLAGTNQPPFVALHVRAAWWAEVHGDPDMAVASRVKDLTAACQSVLVDRASVLRLRSEHDRPRQKLVQLASAARLVASELGDEQAGLERLINRECDVILGRADTLKSDALTQLEAAVAQARHGLGEWLKKHQGETDQKLNAAWQSYLEQAGLYQVLTEYENKLPERLAEWRISAAAVRFPDTTPPQDPRLKAAPGRGVRSWVKSGLRVVSRAAVAAVRSLGVDRGLAKLLAKLGLRATPGSGWWVAGVDALLALSKGARAELRARRLSREKWAAAQRDACLRFISEGEAHVRAALNKADTSLHAMVEDHRTASQLVLDASAQVHYSLLGSAEKAAQATALCDRDLVTALLDHEGSNLRVDHVRRKPNHSMEITFADKGKHTSAVDALNRHLAPETVSATSNRLPVLARHVR